MRKAMHISSGMLALLLLAAPAAMAQVANYAPPKTAWGVPDFQGVWSNASVTKLTRFPGVTGLVMTEEEARRIEYNDENVARDRNDRGPLDPKEGAPPVGDSLRVGTNYDAVYFDAGAHVAKINGQLRSSWIIDPPNGQIPISDDGRRLVASWRASLTPAEKAAILASPTPPPAMTLVNSDGPESRGISERCLIGFGSAGGPVMLNLIYNSHYGIVQTPDHVLINIEMAHDARIIPIVKDKSQAKARFSPDVLEKWLGDSVGWYEGNSLVVQTRNPNPKQPGPVFLTPSGMVTERFTRVSPREMLYEFTVEDPKLYTQAWRGEMIVNQIDEPIFEYACHEGNYGLLNILEGARRDEREGRKVELTSDKE